MQQLAFRIQTYHNHRGEKRAGSETGSPVNFQVAESHLTQSAIIKINLENPRVLDRIGQRYDPDTHPDSYVSLGELIAVEKTFGPGGKWFSNLGMKTKDKPEEVYLSYVTLDFEQGFNSVANITPVSNQAQLVKE